MFHFCEPAGFFSSLFLFLSILICMSWMMFVGKVCLKVGVFIIVGGLLPLSAQCGRFTSCWHRRRSPLTLHGINWQGMLGTQVQTQHCDVVCVSGSYRGTGPDMHNVAYFIMPVENLNPICSRHGWIKDDITTAPVKASYRICHVLPTSEIKALIKQTAQTTAIIQGKAGYKCHGCAWTACALHKT